MVTIKYDTPEKVKYYNTILNYINKIKESKNLEHIKQSKGLNIYNDKFPIECGTYILTFKNNEKYIGYSNNLRRRLNQHKKEWKNIINTDIYIIENELYAHVLETILIIRLKPEHNRSTLGNITEEEFTEMYSNWQSNHNLQKNLMKYIYGK